MPWYENKPSQAELDFWQYVDGTKTHLIKRWPRSNTPRVNCFFRFNKGPGPTFPLASRMGFWYRDHGLSWDETADDLKAFGWFDWEARGEGHLGVTIPENADGYSAEITLKEYDLGEPTFHKGIDCEIVLSHATFGEQKQEGRFSDVPVFVPWRYNMNTREHFGVLIWEWVDWIPGPGTRLHCDIFAVTECYPFARLPPEMASLDGSSAYIKLNDLMTFVSDPFRLSCELRLNQTIDHWPILGRDGTGGFMGMKDDDIIFGNLTLPTSWTPVTDTWVTWVYEFEPETQLQHKLTIAGTVVRDSTNSRQFPAFNTIGVYKHGVSGTLWADMDIRDLKIETGTPGDYTTLLDMPLRENALDAGPQANHGTTFNMALPSV
jgi:hypothetical protein